MLSQQYLLDIQTHTVLGVEENITIQNHCDGFDLLEVILTAFYGIRDKRAYGSLEVSDFRR